MRQIFLTKEDLIRYLDFLDPAPVLSLISSMKGKQQPLDNLRRKGLLPRLKITDQSVYLVDCATSNFAGSASSVKNFIVLLLLIFLRNFIPHLWDTPLRNLFYRYHTNQSLFCM